MMKFTRTKALMLICAIAFAMPWLAMAAGAPVAMVTDLKGKGSAAGAPLALLAQVASDSKIKLEAGSTLTLVYLSSGKEFLFKGPVDIAVGPDAATAAGGQTQTRTLLAAADSSMAIKPAGMAQASVVMRAASDKAKDKGLVLQSPIDTKVLQASPEFRWKTVGPDVSYRFELLDQGGASLYEAKTSQNSLALPASLVLPEGKPLTWEIEATQGTRKLYNSAEFSILPAAVRGKLEALRPAADADFSKRVFFASLLDSQGVYGDATAVWQQLSAERPDDPKLKELAAR